MPCVLEDIRVWISEYHKPNVFSNHFYQCSYCKRPKRCDKHGDKDEDNRLKNVNNVHNSSSQKYRQAFILVKQFKCQNSRISSNSVSISTQFNSIWLTDRTLSGATIQGQIRPGSNGNERVLRIPRSSNINGTSPSDCLVLYTGHSLLFYLSAEQQLVYFTAPADQARDPF